MLKLNASYSKKVPAEGEYSSKSYHCAVEVELPDGLASAQLQSRIHDTFELVRNSVENELDGIGSGKEKPQSTNTREFRQAPPVPNDRKRHQENAKFEQASSRQIKYLLTLGSRQGLDARALLDMAGVDDLGQIERRECSRLIDELSGKTSRAA
jgi:hypothetical protein